MQGTRCQVEDGQVRWHGWERKTEYMSTEKVIDTNTKLREILSEQRENRKIVCTIGSWDILHRGHVEYLAKAKNLGDLLVVGIDSDVAFNRYKRRSPMYPEQDRVRIVASLEYVDYISLIHDVNENGEWQMDLVKTIVPDVFPVYQSIILRGTTEKTQGTLSRNRNCRPFI